jgi:branched-chain amino acid transport system substrate-binding protein
MMGALNSFVGHRKPLSSLFLFPLASFLRRQESTVATKPFEQFDGWIPACAGMTVKVRGVTIFLVLLFLFTTPVQADSHRDTIKIGEFSSYTGLASAAEPSRNGWRMAVEEINDSGGVCLTPHDCRIMEVISRDDKNDPAEVTRVVEELILKKNVDFLLGTILDHVGLAASNLALKYKTPFIKPGGGTSDHIWAKGHRYAFRLDASTDFLARSFADEAVKLGVKRWGIIAPNYEYGRAMVRDFKKYLKQYQPDVKIVAEQWPKLQSVKAGLELQALSKANPEAIFNVLNVQDNIIFIREAKRRNIFQNIPIINPYLGWPTHIEPLTEEAPIGWYTQGYPYSTITEEKHQLFLERYVAKFNTPHSIYALHNYIAVYAIKEAMEKAGTTDKEAVTDALKGLKIDTPIGPITFRSIDNQSTFGAWFGKTGFMNGVPTIVDWSYKDGSDFMPSDEYIPNLRKEK